MADDKNQNNMSRDDLDIDEDLEFFNKRKKRPSVSGTGKPPVTKAGSGPPSHMTGNAADHSTLQNRGSQGSKSRVRQPSASSKNVSEYEKDAVDIGKKVPKRPDKEQSGHSRQSLQSTMKVNVSDIRKISNGKNSRVIHNIRAAADDLEAKTTTISKTQIKEMADKTGKAQKTRVTTISKEGVNGEQITVGIFKTFIYIVIVLLISSLLAYFICSVGNDIFALVKGDDEVTVTVPEDPTIEEIADQLHENKIIKYKKIFLLYANYRNETDGFVSGDHTVSPDMSYDELIDAFYPVVDTGTTWITVPEGDTVDDIIELMVENGIGTKDNYVDVINNYDFDYWFVDELEENGWDDGRIYRLEGYLFPDTYQFYNNSSEEAVINKFLARFDQVYTDDYKERATELGYTTDEIITLASMVEKEAASANEYRNVASVFHNRLNNPSVWLTLDSEACIAYAMAHDLGYRPEEVDVNYDSPYNTYVTQGFPPGPIANPSLSAIKFTEYPNDTNYYFFFYNSFEDVTYFSTTQAEQNAQVARWKVQKDSLSTG